MSLGSSMNAAAQTCTPSPTLPPALVGQSGCTALRTTGIVPLSDLGCGTYRGVQGGLYPNGENLIPAGHRNDGRAAASRIVPRGADGAPDATNGKIGFASLGMSNTEMEFSYLPGLIRTTPGLNPRVVVVNGAQGTRTAEYWADPDSVPWTVFADRIEAAGLSPLQVQALWVKLADGNPSRFGAFPQHAQTLTFHIARTVLFAKARYPNLAIVYLSSRTRAYTAVEQSLNPEPFAYETGFAPKWLIQLQIGGDPLLRHTGTNPPAPWLAWGPYLWADGETPRDDGFTWTCSDVSFDFVHPSHAGQERIAEQLLDFLRTEPTARSWFLAPRHACGLLGIESLAVIAFVAWRRARVRRSAD
jgi:lysophospholipase L1-like esterase